MNTDANPNANPSADFLSGGGEMGERMRSFDWSRHPLGAVEGWSQSLKIVIRIMLTSRYAMWLGWGEEFYFFCNDAYLPTLGIKEDWLGTPARTVWREIWDDVGPRAESVVATGNATWDESLLLFLERSGETEETYHTFSYSPVPDDSGAIGGMLCVVTEETERVIGERRLAMLRDLASDLAAINLEEELFKAIAARLRVYDRDLPFALIYLFDEERRQARLVCHHGAAPDEPIAPAVLALDDPEAVWRPREISNQSATVLVTDLARRFERLPTGPWKQAARQAAVVPISQQGQELAAGFLVAGITPFRPFDDEYRGFIDLLAGQIAAGLSNARAYEAERRRAEALAELDRAKTTFFSNVSHEFRTPLTLMLGPLDDILRRAEGEMSPADRDLLAVVQRNGERLLKLVNTLLDFSRLEAGRAQAVYEPIDLAAYTAELVSVFRSAIEQAGLRLVIHCPSLAEPVYVDRDMWEKIVLNLMSNAFKYTLEGEIRVALEATEDGVTLVVEDTGTGIPQAELPKLFDRFHRVEGARGRTHEGTGIGLALVQELARLHGGSVGVTSTEGVGSAFRVTLPFGKAHLPAEHIARRSGVESLESGVWAGGRGLETASRLAGAEDSGRITREDTEQANREDSGRVSGEDSERVTREANNSGRVTREEEQAHRVETRQEFPHPFIPSPLHPFTSSPLHLFTSSPPHLFTSSSPDPDPDHRPRVLLADDNSDMRDYVRRLLATDYNVIAVGDGEQALAAAAKHLPDLVLTDVMMPKMDGFALLKALRQEPQTAAIPIIMLSARAGEESRVEGLEAGADDYLIKPFSARELLAHIGAALALARVRRERANVEQSLRQSEERLRAQVENLETLLELLPVGVFIGNDPACNDISTNRIGKQMLGLMDGVNPSKTGAEAEALPFRVLRDGREVAGAELPMQRAAREGVKIEGEEFDIVRNDGAMLTLYEFASPLYDADGKVRGALGVFVDITERKRVEAAMRRQSERLRLLWEAAAVLLTTDEPDTMMRELFDKIAPHFALDTYFNFMVTEGSEALRLESCIGVSEETAAAISRLEFGQAICGTVAMQRQPIAATFIQQSDDPLVQLVKSFGIRTYACNPLLTDGRLLGTLSFASRRRDQFEADELEFLATITRYVTVAYERLRLLNELRDNDRRKDEFLATLAHELRNPLAPIRNGLQVMRLAGDDPDAIAQAQMMMERQLQQMVRLIDDLLDLSRISRGKIELRLERVALSVVIQNALETSRPAIEQSSHQLLVSLPTEPLYVQADVTRLAQVFANLLNNAAKYTEKGGRIELGIERQGTEVFVRVKDNGIGIPAPMLSRVFEMFTQVDRSLERSQGGLGIGLNIARRLVEMHGGTIDARSAGQGSGSEFIVRLPLLAAAQESPTIGGSLPATRQTTRRRILVADDNVDSADSLAMMFEILGNDVRTANDGQQAVEVAAAFRPEAILLDIGMPKLNGYEACRRIRQQEWGKAVLIIALTGWGQDDDKRQSQEAGFDHHLVKPVDPEALERLLDDLPDKTA